MVKLSALLSIITIAVLACASSALAGEVRLSAAASLKEAIDELADGFARDNPGVTFRKNFGASGALAKQIENGAPADIFISANREWMGYLQNRGVTGKAAVATFACNTLVFAGTPACKVRGMQDLPRLGRIAIGSPKSVPAGAYAGEAIKRAGIERELEHKLVMARDVRDCLMYAERGEVAGAFVYRTDALQAKEAKVLFTVPQKLYPKVAYPMALTVAGAGNREAASFFKYLQGYAARKTLRKYGFTVK